MKKFIIGFLIGMLFAGTGTYAMLKKKAEKVATKENAEKVLKATQEYGKEVGKVFK